MSGMVRVLHRPHSTIATGTNKESCGWGSGKQDASNPNRVKHGTLVLLEPALVGHSNPAGNGLKKSKVLLCWQTTPKCISGELGGMDELCKRWTPQFLQESGRGRKKSQ